MQVVELVQELNEGAVVQVLQRGVRGCAEAHSCWLVDEQQVSFLRPGCVRVLYAEVVALLAQTEGTHVSEQRHEA